MAAAQEPKVSCRTPNPERPGETGVPEWKFELLRQAILAELATEIIPFAESTGRAAKRVSQGDAEKMGSMGWHVTTVKLELEVRDEIARVSGVSPQVLRLV